MHPLNYLILDVFYKKSGGDLTVSVASQHADLFSNIGIDEFYGYLARLQREGWQLIYVYHMNEQNEIYYIRRNVE
jgi:hypothetical protein